jgi:hypothetical protein
VLDIVAVPRPHPRGAAFRRDPLFAEIGGHVRDLLFRREAA